MQLRLNRRDVELLIASIISYELSKQNKNYFPLHFEIKNRAELTQPPFSCDSLSLVTLASAVGEYFCVKESGLEENFLRHRDFVSWVDIVMDSLDFSSKGLTFFTSGTTGEPKRVFHTFEALQREANYLAKLLSGAKSITAFVRPHHIYGFLYTIALPKIMNIEVTHKEPLPSSEFFHLPSDSLLIATPTLYDIVVQKEEKFSKNVTLVSSTQALKTTTKEKLLAHGASRVIETYGSSETLGVGYRWSDSEHFCLFEYLEKESLCALQDRLLWQNEREFSVGGRLDGAIKERGYLVDTKAYEASIERLAGIEKCELLWSKGELVAFVTPSDKKEAMRSLAEMQEKKPDAIIWVEE